MEQAEIITVSQELIDAERAVEIAHVRAWYDIGAAFASIKDGELWHEDNGGTHTNWRSYCMERWGKDATHVDRTIGASKLIGENCRIRQLPQNDWPQAESQSIELAKLDDPDKAAEVWGRVLERRNGNRRITAKDVKAEVAKAMDVTAAQKDYWTLGDWQGMSDGERIAVLGAEYEPAKFNEQKNDNIEWARYSWNPVTGCLHGCVYCYARDIADRYYPQGFNPTFIPSRLNAPGSTKQKNIADMRPIDQIGYSSVFVCSMADLFGKWVPREWIEAVLLEVEENPQWNFLFLTKFPQRMAEFTYPDNAWLGTTVDRPEMVERAEKGFDQLRESGYSGIAWVSCEPLLGPVKFDAIRLFDWIVIGGQSRSSGSAAFQPPYWWHADLSMQARDAGIPIYHKTNIGFNERVREYPKQWNTEVA